MKELSKSWYEHRPSVIRCAIGITKDQVGTSHPLWIFEGIIYALNLNNKEWGIYLASEVDSLGEII